MAHEELGHEVVNAAETILENERQRIGYIAALTQEQAPELEDAFFGEAPRPENEAEVLFQKTANALRLIELQSIGVITAPRVRTPGAESLDRAIVQLGWADAEPLQGNVTVLSPQRTFQYLLIPTEKGRGLVNGLRRMVGEPPVEEEREANRQLWLQRLDQKRQLRLVTSLADNPRFER